MPRGLVLGGLGVLAFSMSLPATRLTVAGFEPLFVGSARAVAAGLLAGLVLLVGRGGRPRREEWRGLVLVALGAVLGFPLLTSVAMTRAGAVHGAILTGLLPAATAVAAVLLARERPSVSFWLAAGAGVVAVLAFAAVQGAGMPGPADAMLLAAVAICAVAYAAGGVLARSMGGLRVIGWALVLSLPVTLVLAVVLWDGHGVRTAPWSAWAGFAYVAFISQYVGFLPWYRGLAVGGVARVGQLQLAQPVLSMLWATLLLGEVVTLDAVLAAGAVLACVVMTQRAR